MTHHRSIDHNLICVLTPNPSFPTHWQVDIVNTQPSTNYCNRSTGWAESCYQHRKSKTVLLQDNQNLLRLPMTYDNHPNPIQPTKPL